MSGRGLRAYQNSDAPTRKNGPISNWFRRFHNEANPCQWIHTFASFAAKPSFLGRKSLSFWFIPKKPCVAQDKIDRCFQDVCFPCSFQVSNSSFCGGHPTPGHRLMRRTPPGSCHQRPALRRPCPPDLFIGRIPFIKGNRTIFGDPLINQLRVR